MAWASLVSLAHDDEEKYDLAKGLPDSWEPPDYPSGCCFSLTAADLAKAKAEGGDPGDSMRFSAMGEVTSIHKGVDTCRIELELTRFAGDDGKFFDLENPSHICLTQAELGKMDLDADCERGDTIHLVGTARMETSSSTEYGGETVGLQIVELGYVEDESGEAREG